MRAVLIEKSKEKNQLSGFTDNYIKVDLQGPESLINQICQVELIDYQQGIMKAQLVKSKRKGVKK